MAAQPPPQQQQQQQQAYGGYPQPGGHPQQQQQMAPGQQPVYNQPGMQMAYVNPQMAVAMQGMAPPAQPMPKPAPVPGCPPGLEYLTQIDQLLIHQQVELFELFTNWECANKYQIKNNQGQQVYFSGEESDTCQRQCCGPGRGFLMHITDNNGEEVIKVSREFKCCAAYCPGCTTCCACCNCCAQEIVIEAPVGEVVGRVRQQVSCMAPKFEVIDASDTPILKIEGPVCIVQGPCCTEDIEFLVTSPDGEQVGKISKQWSGYMKEAFTQADNFGVSFPMDLDVKIKAVMVGAVFLIDFMFFERKNNNRGRHHHY